MKSNQLFYTVCKTFLFLLLLQLLMVVPVSSQSISGKITSREGAALSGVSVCIKGTKNVSLTDSMGHFSLNAIPGSVIEISTIGYQTHHLILGSETAVNISLTENIVSLDDVLAIGYGTSTRKDITGAVARITVNEFNTGVITNPLQQIQGKVAGVVIVQPGGDPNGDLIVRIRGATSLEGQPPLLVIDGVAIDDFNRAITTLNPADIESFDILKDVSAAAIYGARGGNGIILITTKSSRVGKTLVDYNSFVGLEKISNQLNLLNADEWRKATVAYGGGGLDKGANMDWQKEISRTGISHSHTVGISGGNTQFNFRGSIGYTRQEGVIINSGKEIITGRLTANQKAFNNKLEIGYGINISVIKRDFMPDQSATSQVRSRGSEFFALTLAHLPVLPAYKPDGSYFQVSNINIINPLYQLKEVYSKLNENFFGASLKADYEVIKGLRAGLFGSLSKGNDVYDYFYPGITDRSEKSIAAKRNNNKHIFSADIHGSYSKRFGKHAIDVTGVYEFNQFVNDGFGVTARGFLVRELLNNNLRTATDVQTNDISSYKNEVKLISFLGRAVYNFADRFLLTVNFRRDGSSKFGPNNRWGNFPSVALAWRLSNEAFMNQVRWIGNLKLRMSYGLTGNQENLPPYSYQLLYGPAGLYLYNGQFLQSYAIVQENNPDLKWEVRKSFNLGLDFSVLSDRINGTIDYFQDKTNDMLFLYDLPQPPFLTNKVYANAASAVNKGLEISLGGTIVNRKKFSWKSQVNIGTLKNYITSLSGKFKTADLSLDRKHHYGYAEGAGLGNAYITQLEIGYPAGVFWIPEHAGIDATGRELYNNYDATGKLVGTSTQYADQDRVFIDPTPDFTWGLTNSFTRGNFDLSFFFRGVQGQKVFANSLLNLEAVVYLPGKNITEKGLANGFKEQPQPSTYWLRDGSFTRLENITLGYNFKNIKSISKLRCYLTVTNLFVITSYEGIDPEIKTDGSQRYIDRNSYPKTRGIVLGVTVDFR